MLRRNNKSIKIPFFSSRDLRATCNYTQTDFTANPGGGGNTTHKRTHMAFKNQMGLYQKLISATTLSYPISQLNKLKFHIIDFGVGRRFCARLFMMF